MHKCILVEHDHHDTLEFAPVRKHFARFGIEANAYHETKARLLIRKSDASTVRKAMDTSPLECAVADQQPKWCDREFAADVAGSAV